MPAEENPSTQNPVLALEQDTPAADLAARRAALLARIQARRHAANQKDQAAEQEEQTAATLENSQAEVDQAIQDAQDVHGKPATEANIQKLNNARRTASELMDNPPPSVSPALLEQVAQAQEKTGFKTVVEGGATERKLTGSNLNTEAASIEDIYQAKFITTGALFYDLYQGQLPGLDQQQLTDPKGTFVTRIVPAMLATAGMDEPKLRQFAFGTEGFNKHLGRMFQVLKAYHEHKPSADALAAVTEAEGPLFIDGKGEPAHPEHWRNPLHFAEALSRKNEAPELAELDAQIDAPET